MTGHFRIVLTGFTVNHETWDHAFQIDGKRDEVYLSNIVRLIDRNAATLLSTERRSQVMGDANGFPGRVQAGSASARGGLQTGDSFPTADPWVIADPIALERPPMLVFEGDLEEDRHAVTVTPTIWEYDGNVDLFNEWGKLLADNAPAVVGAAVNLINGPPAPGANAPGDFIKTNLEMGLPKLFAIARNVIGNAGDRPIGTVQENGNYTFSAQTIILNYGGADFVARSDFGLGAGVLPVTYRDAGNLAGDYTLYFKVERVGSPNGAAGRRVSFRTVNRFYVVAEGGGGRELRADRVQAREWETFTLTDLTGGGLESGDSIYLQAHNGSYVCAENGGGAEVVANRVRPLAWETFTIVKLNGAGEIRNGDRVALQARNGQYCVAEHGGGAELNANRNAIGPWETFEIVI
jgi:hypothetical protein